MLFKCVQVHTFMYLIKWRFSFLWKYLWYVAAVAQQFLFSKYHSFPCMPSTFFSRLFTSYKACLCTQDPFGCMKMYRLVLRFQKRGEKSVSWHQDVRLTRTKLHSCAEAGYLLTLKHSFQFGFISGLKIENMSPAFNVLLNKSDCSASRGEVRTIRR